jgi:small-conductance mechanosensitive channel
MKTFTFNTKATYLAYRSNWKAQYKQLSANIREQKAYIRSQSTPSSEDYYTLRCMKDKATASIEELKEARAEAQRQYLAAHEREMVLA